MAVDISRLAFDSTLLPKVARNGGQRHRHIPRARQVDGVDFLSVQRRDDLSAGEMHAPAPKQESDMLVATRLLLLSFGSLRVGAGLGGEEENTAAETISSVTSVATLCDRQCRPTAPTHQSSRRLGPVRTGSPRRHAT